MIGKTGIFTAAITRIVPNCNPTGTGAGACDIPALTRVLVGIYWFAIEIGAIITVLLFIWGGFLLLISTGSQERITQGKKAMTSAVVGFIIVLTAYVVVNTLITWFTNCSNWTKFTC